MNFWEDCNNLDMWRRQVIKTLPTLAEDSSKLHGWCFEFRHALFRTQYRVLRTRYGEI